MTESEIIDNIYRKLAFVKVKCNTDKCKGVCCGGTVFSGVELERLIKSSEFKERVKERVLKGELMCPFLGKDDCRCGVYSLRPVVCRLMGCVKSGMMYCEYAQVENPLQEWEAGLIMADYFKTTGHVFISENEKNIKFMDEISYLIKKKEDK